MLRFKVEGLAPEQRPAEIFKPEQLIQSGSNSYNWFAMCTNPDDNPLFKEPKNVILYTPLTQAVNETMLSLEATFKTWANLTCYKGYNFNLGKNSFTFWFQFSIPF